MNRIKILNVLTAILSEMTKKPAMGIQEKTPLISSGLVDSIHLAELAGHIEDEFGVVIADTELDGRAFDTLGSLADLISLRRP